MKLLLGFVLRASDATYGKEHAVPEAPGGGSPGMPQRTALCGLLVTVSLRPFSEAARPCKRCLAAAKRIADAET